MKVTDLTHVICDEMPVFPGSERPIVEKVAILEKDGFRESKITMYSHIGTHIDAPAHVLEKGLYLDDLDIGHFIGNAVILDFSHWNGISIDVESLKNYKEKIRNVEFVIIKTDWSKYWGTERYYRDFPFLSEESAKWLSQFNIKGVGIDAISIDNIESTTLTVHKILLSKNMIIIENLTNLDSIEKDEFILSVMPIKIKKADGAPVRAISIENI
jgi:kynurenine formamidase